MTKAKKAEVNTDGAVSYAELRRQLDEIMTKLQDPECDVDQAADLYGQAMQVVVRLETYLQTAENRVRKIQADLNADGVVD